MRTRRLLFWLLAFAPLLITFFVLPILPDRIPAHYGFDGAVTRYGSKYEMLILPIITIGMAFFWLLMKKIASKDKEKGTQNVKVLYWSSVTTTLVFIVLQIWYLRLSYTSADNIYSGEFDLMKVIAICMGIAYIIIGNLLPKCKQNYIVGIRTIWTLESELSWYKTHRLGGKVMVLWGIISTLLCLFIFDGIIALLISVGGLVVVIIPIMLYSRYVYKQEKE